MIGRGRIVGAAVVVAALVVGGVGTATVATAAPADQGLASTNPQNNTPKVLNGRVQAIKRVGDTVLVGGSFTQVQEAAANSPILPRSGLFAFDANTGVVSTSFNPVLTTTAGKTPSVNALTVAPGGQLVYVGGDYRSINGGGPARLQALQLSDGQRSSSFGNKAPNSKVFDLALAGDRLYAAGSFKSVGGVARGGMASFDTATGNLTDALTLPFTGTTGKGTTTVRKIDLTPSGDRLVAIGNFNAVNGTQRLQVAMLDTHGATATLDGWSTTRFGLTDCSRSFDTYMRDVDISPDGSFFVVVATGGFGGSSGVKLCDSASRWETYATGSQQPTWVDYTGGDTFWAVEVTGPVAYVGGHFRWMNNLLSRGDEAGPGSVTRTGLAALDTRNGLPFSWDPTRTRGVGVFDFHVTQTELWQARTRQSGPVNDGIALPRSPGTADCRSPTTGSAAFPVTSSSWTPMQSPAPTPRRAT